MAAKRCPKCNVFMNKTATVCLKCGWKETTETSNPVNTNMENKVVSQHTTNNPPKSETASNPPIQPMNRTREQSNNNTINPEKNIPKNPHDYPTCEDGSYDFEKFTKYQMELLFDKYDLELPEFDCSKEDLVDLFVSLTESEDDEYEDPEYEEDSEDDEYEEDVEEYEKMNMDDEYEEDSEDDFDEEESGYNDEENEDDEEDEIDYSSLSLSELQKLCDERGINYSERDKKSKIIMFLVQADESDMEQEEEDEEIDYSELSIPELKQLCDQYELNYSEKTSKNSLIAMLCAYEEELEEETDDEDVFDEEDSEYDDEEEFEEEYDEDAEGFDFIDFSAYTIAELKEMCDERNIKYKAKEKKQNLVMKLEEYEGYYDDLEDEEEQTTTSSASNITKLLGKVKKQPSETKEEQEEDDTVGNSSYQPNYDHYYDDVLPEVVAEMERIPKDAILKAIGGVILVFAAIVFFIYYF